LVVAEQETKSLEPMVLIPFFTQSLLWVAVVVVLLLQPLTQPRQVVLAVVQETLVEVVLLVLELPIKVLLVEAQVVLLLPIILLVAVAVLEQSA
jgi:hypothetical protein